MCEKLFRRIRASVWYISRWSVVFPLSHDAHTQFVSGIQWVLYCMSHFSTALSRALNFIFSCTILFTTFRFIWLLKMATFLVNYIYLVWPKVVNWNYGLFFLHCPYFAQYFMICISFCCISIHSCPRKTHTWHFRPLSLNKYLTEMCNMCA